MQVFNAWCNSVQLVCTPYKSQCFRMMQLLESAQYSLILICALCRQFACINADASLDAAPCKHKVKQMLVKRNVDGK